MNTEKIQEQVIAMFVEYGPKVLGAIIVFIVGGWVIKLLNKGISNAMDSSKIDQSLKPFFKGIISTLLKALLVISVLSMVGIEMTSFVAIIGAAGLAVGLALSGTLQNFAGGVVILIFKPFKVGDYVEVGDYSGFVKEIQIFNTIIRTLQHKTIIVPNGGLSTSSLTNYSTEDKIRLEWTFGIAYGDDVKIARKVITELALADDRIAKDPAFFVGLIELGDSSVNLTARGWVSVQDYWGVFFDLNESVYEGFKTAGLSIPFPQMDVYVQNK